MHYYNTWKNLFGIKFIKLWIVGDSEENVENIFICGMLSHDEYFFVNILIINETRSTAAGGGAFKTQRLEYQSNQKLHHCQHSKNQFNS